ncbi:phosphoribosylglycinamide formyltransferase [Limibacillus sp. MBR-115]|uniref:phosphoribosylglycinamide formyltransferase n=1 Tax=Limibacillus sp. MBR-115 TaxID=3156465 RepID=UPI00339AF736
MAGKLKVSVLISGRGSNLQALIDACRSPDFPAEIVMVVSNRPDAQGLFRAQAAGISTAVIEPRDFPDKVSFDRAMTEVLESSGTGFICLAGFMRLLSPEFVDHWRDRMINIHPSLLPLFPGLDTHRRALDAGMRLHGCSVHFVRHEMDSGPIIGQAAVAVLDGDDPDSLSSRVLEAEHLLYPWCLELVARGMVTVTGDTCRIAGHTTAPSPLVSPARS